MRPLKITNAINTKIDWVLGISLLTGFVFCLYGINWPQEHPDDMAFRPLFLPDKRPLNPGWFHKPPFHTYFNYFLSSLPIDTLGKLFNLSDHSLDFAKTVWSRILTSFLLLFSVVVVYKLILKSFDLFSARMVASIFATSAGFVAYSHFLTADIPVMFWMLLAFYFSFKIMMEEKISNYLLAGFFTGIATATKYNGLAIGMSLTMAHFLSCHTYSWKSFDWKKLFASNKFYFGLSMVVVGFVVGNPYALFDFRTFKSDFVYNYIVTPVYDGQQGNSYRSFFWHISEVIGIPFFIVCALAFLYSIFFISTKGVRSLQTKTIFLSLSVLLVYYYKFGSFPRLETRFVLPLVPFLLIVSATLWHTQKQFKKVFLIVAFLLIVYNIVCSFYVGRRFLNDPRSGLHSWIEKNIPTNSNIERDLYTPSFVDLKQKNIKETAAPNVSGRERIFASIFKNDSFILGPENDREKQEEQVKWYSQKNLLNRNPDFIGLNSLYYTRFTIPGIKQNLYPTMNEYFQDLLTEKYSYKIIFDMESKLSPWWVYPRQIDFLHNRMTILAKKKLLGLPSP